MRFYDVIVVGAGGIGSSALYHLARRGMKVLGLEQFDIGHDRGSAHGATRLIRRAYFEHPSYVPLVDSAYRLWTELEDAASRTLLHRCGLMLAGRPDGAIVTGVLRAAREHRLAIESVAADQWSARFPNFRIDADMHALFEPDAGFLEVENCIRTHAELARAHGAEVRTGVRVVDWTADPRGVQVVTQDGRYHADKIVICGGAWAGTLLSSLGLPLEVRRKAVVWFGDEGGMYAHASGCPVFGFDAPDFGFYYGFPAIDSLGVKVSDHAGGQVVGDADALNREVHPDDEAPLQRFVAQYAPSLSRTITKRSVCMYTMTPDEHFIVDRHPQLPNVLLACGFSGHGFKFAPVIGEVLADYAIDGRTSHPVDFLRLDRPSLQ